MTAEIAIMNKQAVALAADSAVTINMGPGLGQKIYNTNKLFALSKYHPVGIMVYDLAELMGVPWEAVIKCYRAELGKKSFGSLREYVEDFLSFFRQANRILPATHQRAYFFEMIAELFQSIQWRAVRGINNLIAKNGQVTHREVQHIVAVTLKTFHAEAVSWSLLPHFQNSDMKRLASRYWAEIADAKKSTFQQLPLPSEADEMLKDIVTASFCREWSPFGASGVVFAGYGEEQIFPTVCALRFNQVLDGQLKYSGIEESSVTAAHMAAIIPFAQREMASVFMEGVDPDYKDVVENYLRKMFNDYPVQLVNLIPRLDAKTRDSLLPKLRKVGADLFSHFVDGMNQYRQANHVRPVVGAVSFLSKDMLAEVAEALVSLTSFKRRISITSAETVGGPIDVAVISKGDGFIWIKRKQYFKPELNHHFVNAYFGDDDEKKTKSRQTPGLATRH
jgi:hypothetical protein